jgi:hypothetical protein
MEVVPDRSARSLCGFVEAAVEPGVVVVTDAWGGYATLPDRGYRHLPVAAQGDPSVGRGLSADLPFDLQQSEKLAPWLPSRRQPSASSSLSQRVHVPVQSPFLPVQRVPVIARDQRADCSPNV